MTTRISQLVVKVAERCNLRCKYCYLYERGDDTFRSRPKFLSEETFCKVLERVQEYSRGHGGTQVALVLHGGEPTLIGVDRIARMAELAGRMLSDGAFGGIHIQTNGTLIDSSWVDVFRTYDMQVSISIDGPRHIHDASRVDHAGRGSHERITRTIERLRDGGVMPSALCVVNPRVSGEEVYRHLRSLGLTRFDFLLPDASHDSKPLYFADLPPLSVGRYLQAAFDAWFEEDDPAVEVRLFRGMISALLGGRHETDQFGNGLAAYLVIETDGSIQPNDVLRVCENGMTSSEATVYTHSFDDAVSSRPLLQDLMVDGMRLSEACTSCDELRACGGGYAPHRYSRANGFRNPSIWCADIYFLLGHIRDRLCTSR